MVGLDRTVLDVINSDRVMERIRIDVRTDFILAPHVNAIFVNVGDQVWSRSAELLRAGKYQPSLPYTISVPKGRGFIRPGSILSPLDRFIYQALIDLASGVLEEQIDRSRAFSHVLSQKKGYMFEPAHRCWEKFQGAIRELCNTGTYIVKADISNYFERIPQHHLVNLLRAAGCRSGVVNLLEEMLLSFQGRNSFGILQGLFPSDILGNFFLSDLDAYFELKQTGSARYNDDIYLQYRSHLEAQRGLIELIERLQKDGLHLNEFKSGIWATKDIIREATGVDTLFDAAREEIHEELTDQLGGYGFTAEWEFEEETDEGIHLATVERLYEAIDSHPEQSENIERFCLPVLRAAKSDSAIDDVLHRLTTNSHLTRLYHSYLARFVGEQKELRLVLEEMVRTNGLITDYERMYLLGSLFNADSVGRATVNKALLWLTSTNKVVPETRAVAAIFAAKHGKAVQKRAVRVAYDDEPSEYVRSAILYSSLYMTAAERRTCRLAWGGHSTLNALTAQALSK